jgi:hypothetical protein
MSLLIIFLSQPYAGITFGAGSFSSSVVISNCFSTLSYFRFFFFSSAIVF